MAPIVVGLSYLKRNQWVDQIITVLPKNRNSNILVTDTPMTPQHKTSPLSSTKKSSYKTIGAWRNTKSPLSCSQLLPFSSLFLFLLWPPPTVLLSPSLVVLIIALPVFRSNLNDPRWLELWIWDLFLAQVQTLSSLLSTVCLSLGPQHYILVFN